MRNGSGSRKAEYTANNLNQYTSRTVPGALDILGSAHSNSTITINGQAATRQGAYYHKEITVTNEASAVWQPIEVVGVLTNITVTNTGHLFLAKTPEAFTHDLDGNQTSDGHWTNTWDGANHLISMETRGDLPGDIPRQRLEFQYDFQGRRVRNQVFSWNSGSWVLISDIRFIYDGWNLLAEVNSSAAALRSYVWGLDLSGSMQGAGGVGGLLAVNAGTNGTHFVTSDGNGNVVGLYKSNDAAVTAVFEYGPFGDTLRATGLMATEMPLRFSTKYQDNETGLHYFPFRYYNGVCWLSRDPIGEVGGENYYLFVHNGPPNAVDSFGQLEYTKTDTRFYSVTDEKITLELGELTLDSVHIDADLTETFYHSDSFELAQGGPDYASYIERLVNMCPGQVTPWTKSNLLAPGFLGSGFVVTFKKNKAGDANCPDTKWRQITIDGKKETPDYEWKQATAVDFPGTTHSIFFSYHNTQKFRLELICKDKTGKEKILKAIDWSSTVDVDRKKKPTSATVKLNITW